MLWIKSYVRAVNGKMTFTQLKKLDSVEMMFPVCKSPVASELPASLSTKIILLITIFPFVTLPNSGWELSTKLKRDIGYFLY